MAIRKATEQSGVAGLHIDAIAEVCRKRNCFLFIRPSELATVRLIKQGFATKSMDIHDKSSDWGLTAGLVPVDQAFSKALKGTPNPAIHPHAHGEAQPVELVYSAAQYASLGRLHFEHLSEVQPGQSCFSVSDAPTCKHFHSPKNSQVCFMWSTTSGKVTWKWRSQVHPNGSTPVWVWGYKGVPVTGDYDMWMVAPHYQDIKKEGLARILTNLDEHGRSAALKYTQNLAKVLNDACTPRYPNGKNVFNHGAEAQNYSFTQEMEKKDLVVFCPGRHEPFLIHALREPENLTQLFHDMLRHGYVVMRNPKWQHGYTLASEDLAFVPDELLAEAEAGEVNAMTNMVNASRQAVDRLENGAATMVQRAFHAKKMEREGRPQEEIDRYRIQSSTREHRVFKGRAAKLLEFRKVAKIPDDQGRDLILLPEAFPIWNQTALKTDATARVIGQQQEAGFGRTNFVLEGKPGERSLVPIDGSK